jgi:hypothetical protein
LGISDQNNRHDLPLKVFAEPNRHVMADLTKMGLSKANITRKRPKERTSAIHHNGHDPEMITRTHAETGKIVSRHVPGCPNYNLDHELAHDFIVKPENNAEMLGDGYLRSAVLEWYVWSN